MRKFKVILAICCLYLHCAQNSNILGVFSTPSISHQVVYQAVWRELSLRGHQLTVLTPNPLNDSNLLNVTEIDLKFVYKILQDSNIQKLLHKSLPMTKIFSNFYEIHGAIAEVELSHPRVQEFIRDKNKKFDVMLVEFVHPVMYALSAHFNCPMIGISSFDALLPGHDAIGNPSHPVLNPDLLLPLGDSLGFFDRIYSLYFSLWIRYYYHNYLLPSHDKIARKYIGANLPYLGDIERNVSLLFLSVNPLLHRIRPNVPAVIQVGKMHIKKAQLLPRDLQTDLDNATEGAVYFSLGSNIKSVGLSLKVRSKIIEVISKLPYKVFWKWENDCLPNQPENLVIRKWFPQQDVLGHPNVKVFLMQGGLQSIEEAISKKVPMVIMPFFGDQPLNAQKVVNLGIAQLIDPERFTIEKLKRTLIDVVENPKYRNKIKEVFNLMNDEPMTGLQKAVWWTEYVIRNKGAPHLRSPTIDIPWHQYLLLVVLLFILLSFLFLVYFAYIIVLFIIKGIRNNVYKNKRKMG